MERTATLVCCLLLVVGGVTAQTGSPARLLPQWGVGLLAVAGFLFLSFVVLLVKKAWFENPNRRRRNSVDSSVRPNDFAMNDTFTTDLRDSRIKADVNTYDNLVIDISEEKLTAM
ncbi:PDZK1-interacting protein 1 [Acanthochromis polyacanthus]|uniref:PDZK1-interacting protein 1 n=1 Tax=Acanthochromis polyacanthus TaxID=80966 RepID=UPI0022346DD4|nr:PDZK1-interacting protein 1 [Acanthochromis polyacanthus]